MKMIWIFLIATCCQLLKAVTGSLTVGWVDTVVVVNKPCEPGADLVFSAKYIILYSSHDIGTDIMTSCYCTLTPNTSQSLPPPNMVFYERLNATMFNPWMNLSGVQSWGIADNRESLYLEVSPGSDPYLELSVLNRSLSLNHSVHIDISHFVNVNCSTDAYVIPTLPVKPPTSVFTNPTTQYYDTTPTAVWFTQTRLLIVISGVAITVFVTGIICVCCCVHKRRKKSKDSSSCDVTDTEWRTPSTVVSAEMGDARPASFAEVDTFIDDKHSTLSTTTNERSVDKQTLDSKRSDASSGGGGVGNAESKSTKVDYSLDTTATVKSGSSIKTPTSTSTTNSNVKAKIKLFSNESAEASCASRGITTNQQTASSRRKPEDDKAPTADVISQHQTSVDSRDNYIQPDESGCLLSNDEKRANDDVTASEPNARFSGIDEVPEYAEIEEMQMLLRKPLAASTQGSTNQAAPKVPDKRLKQTDKTADKMRPRRAFGCFGRKAKSRRKKSDAVTSDNFGVKPLSSVDRKNSQFGDMELANLDFSQLKDAIDKMDPYDVTKAIDKVSSGTPTASRRRKDGVNTLPISEHIYTNAPPPKPPRVGLGGSLGKATNNSDTVKYDSPKNSFIEKADNVKCDKLAQTASTVPGTPSTTVEPDTTELAATTDAPTTTTSAATKAPTTTIAPITTKAPTTTIAQTTTKAPTTTIALNTTKAPTTTNTPTVTQSAATVTAPNSEEGGLNTPTTNVPKSERLRLMIPNTSDTQTSDLPHELLEINNRPTSPVRGRWGDPVLELYAQPQKPSRLPRPTSPTPQSPSNPLSPVSSLFTALGNDANLSDRSAPVTSQYRVPVTSSLATQATTVRSPVFSPVRKHSFPSQNVASSPVSPTPPSPSGLTSLGLVVKATEALQTPVNQCKRPNDVKPKTSSAFNAAMERINKLQQPQVSTTSQPPSQHDSRKPYVIAVKSQPKSIESPSNNVVTSGDMRNPASTRNISRVQTADALMARKKQTPARSTSGYDNVKSVPTSQSTPDTRGAAAVNRRKASDPGGRTFVVDKERRSLWEKPDNVSYNFAQQISHPKPVFKI